MKLDANCCRKQLSCLIKPHLTFVYVLKQLMNYWIHLTILILRKNRITHCFQLFLQNLKVSNVDTAWSQHDNNKDVETDSSFFFFTLLNLSENYFHKSQTKKCHRNVNGGNIHTSSAGVNDMIFLPFRYSIPDTPYSVPAAVGTSELSSLINQILKGTQSYVNKLVLIQG